MSSLKKLYTKEGELLNTQPWDRYPRPQLKRDSFFCLNGSWDFAVTKGEEPASFAREIRVPFAPESMLSGIDERFSEEETLWYRKSFTLPNGFIRERVLLHFGAVDQYATVYVNGTLVGEHVGGYHPFSFDITALLQEENTILLKVTDHLSNFLLPYGKQKQNRGGMWYTPVSGIWQTVWVESVPTQYIRKLKIDVGENRAEVRADGISEATVTVQTPNGEVSFPMKDGYAKITLDAPRHWSPEDPYLYRFTVTAESDKVESYFALRTLDIRTVDGYSRLCLNGKPYFFHGLLDQGYWSDGLLTPAAPECYEQDILAMKSLGFNMLRKHIKIEPELFYYDCDRLGMVVFQDMVNNGNYTFWFDTALPTAGLLYFNDKFLHRDQETRAHFIREMDATVDFLYNHPCICYWTIFNEGWGQFESTKQYHHLRTLDKSRFIDSTSGWFLGGDTDVDSRHVYFKKIRLKVKNRPLVLSEFGGYSWKPEGHVANTETTYGYGHHETRESFVEAFRKLYLTEVLPLVKKGLSASIYTQVSDVEDEANGLLTYDRKVLKVLPEEFKDISDDIYRYGNK